MSDAMEAFRALFANLPPEEQQRLLAQLATPASAVTGTAEVSGEARVTGSVIGVNQGVVNNFFGPNPPDNAATLIATYLDSLCGDAGRLSLSDVDSTDVSKAVQRLDAVYVGVEVASTVEDSGNFLQRQRQRTALEALMLHPKLVLLGDPGGGKSTFVNFVALCLGSAQRETAPGLAGLGEGWTLGSLFPIRIVLREFAKWVEQSAPPHCDAAHLWWHYLTTQHGETLTIALKKVVGEGKALLLLDGLDEVLHNMLSRVVAAITSLQASPSRVVVTCRIRDYQAASRQISAWPTETIIPLNTKLQTAFIDQWFANLKTLNRPVRGEPLALAEGLKRAIQSRPELGRLSGNPLLLTMMAHLQGFDGTLPDERVKLYERSVEFLLLHWRRDVAGKRPLGEVLNLPQWSTTLLGQLLDRLGFAAHSRGVTSDGQQGADLPEAVVIDVAQRFFARFEPKSEKYRRAEAFVEYISAHGNGVLQLHAAETYRFPHRTFQEYFAARRLVSDEEWAEEDAEFADRVLQRAIQGSQWREAILLAVSQWVVAAQQTGPSLLAAEGLVERGANSDILLAAEILLELGKERAQRRGKRAWEGTHTALLGLVKGGMTGEPVAERVRAGLLLGQMGDPRYPISIEEWRASLQALDRTQRRDDDHYWRYVPAGTYVIGSTDADPEAGDEEKPQHAITLAQPIWVARFPITNAQWQAYVAAGGKQSPYVDTPRFNQANQPVVGVSQRMSVAFGQWLMQQVVDALPAGYEVRLPTEFEWEAAARGGDGRVYPWGDGELTVEHAVYREWGLDGAAPVGICPVGGAPCGALDMAGNVWEWTTSGWQSYKGAEKGFTAENSRVLRGGGYLDDRTSVRCGARDWAHPDFIDSYGYGFRVVLAPRK